MSIRGNKMLPVHWDGLIARRCAVIILPLIKHQSLLVIPRSYHTLQHPAIQQKFHFSAVSSSPSHLQNIKCRFAFFKSNVRLFAGKRLQWAPDQTQVVQFRIYARNLPDAAPQIGHSVCPQAGSVVQKSPQISRV